VSAKRLELRLRLPLGAFALDLDLESDARALGLFGASGAGKTSALECIAGWRAMPAGRIRVGSRVLFDAAEKIDVGLDARRVGYVPQEPLLFPHWSVRDNVRASRRVDEAVFARCVDVLEIGKLLERAPATLSGGEARRVSLARALCSAPDLLLFDEPLAALELPLRRRILSDLVRVRDAFSVPMIFVSHDPTEVQTLCDEVAIVEHGRVRAQGDPRALLRETEGETFENVLEGIVSGEDSGGTHVAIDAGVEVVIGRSDLARGSRVAFALDADDVLVSTRPLEHISARNRLACRIESVETRRQVVRLEVALGGALGTRVLVHVTAGAVRELSLMVGGECWLVFKASSCRVLAASSAASQATSCDDSSG